MKASNMETIKKYLEKSTQNVSLNGRRRRVGRSTEESSNEHITPSSDRIGAQFSLISSL
ncbi:hypothetical protein F2Q68_00001386 [Brassica cretica]|uniref:Uncharacterized protein n=2 Tax=Brassica cretica TaxID=69181 RepID=A0ABQ7C8H7_BRACR|nr:hypothetical protein F2Q68_00001386 [Brassica cretica]KAF3547588.1 hypothetical protein DY000_02001815 [Brassica cretica]